MVLEWYRKNLNPLPPTLTEKNLPDQSGKIFIVTGANSGVGEQLAGILYGANAKVYAAARSAEKNNKAIQGIKSAHPKSTGGIIHLQLDLADLTTIKQSAETFLAAESRLDVLWLNAGVMIPPQGSKTKQGYELQLGTNNLGHFLFVKHVQHMLAKTAAVAPKNSVRIIWVSSSAADFAPKPPIELDNMDYHKNELAWTKYFRSKAGNVVHSVEFARRHEGEGIISLSLNPGNLNSGLQRTASPTIMAMTRWLMHPAIFGAYTELYAGLSNQITEKNNAGWLIPWGIIHPIRKDLAEPELGRKYWEWSEEQVKDY